MLVWAQTQQRSLSKLYWLGLGNEFRLLMNPLCRWPGPPKHGAPEKRFHGSPRALRAAMPDPLSPIQRTVMLRRIDLEHSMARYYSLMIERDLFGTVRLVRHWGRIGAMQGRELAQNFQTEEKAAGGLERLAAVKRRRGYVDL